MEELQGLLLKIQGKVETFNSWAAKLREALKGQGDDRIGRVWKKMFYVICFFFLISKFLSYFVIQN